METETENLQKIKQVLQAYYESLPPALQYASLSEEVQNMLSELKEKYSLTKEEDVALSNEVLYVLFGVSKREDFKNNLIKAGFIEEKATPLAEEVDSLIFAPVEKELKEVEQRNTNYEEQESSEIGDYDNKEGGDTSVKTTETKEEVLKEIESPEEFDVPFQKTSFEKKLEEVPETKEDMLKELQTPESENTGNEEKKDETKPEEAFDPLSEIQNKKNEIPKKEDLFPAPKKDAGDQKTNDPYREPI